MGTRVRESGGVYVIPADGPFYDDIPAGYVFPSPPAVTLEGGLAAAYQAIAGEALPLTLDRRLSFAVTGVDARLASPGLVMHLSIGASTVATKRVVANLFYRNVVLRRPVFEGQTLRTTTRVLAMADSAPKPGREPRGKVLLGIATSADDDPVIEYERCPLIRLRGSDLPGHGDLIGSAGGDLELDTFVPHAPTAWNLEPLGPSASWVLGEERTDPLRDVIDGAVALVRLTHNVAAVHRDADASPYAERLVYGGHTVALAQASLTRVLPGLATVIGWHSCDHTGPVFEGDVLAFSHTLVDEVALPSGRVRAIRVEVTAERGDERVRVLDWTPIVFTT